MVASDTHMPIERTFSEWAASQFPGGVYAPEFAGAKPDGIDGQGEFAQRFEVQFDRACPGRILQVRLGGIEF